MRQLLPGMAARIYGKPRSMSGEDNVKDVESAVRLVTRSAEEHGRWITGSATAVRCALVDPILWALGWSTWLPAQCMPELNLRQRGVAHYALFDPDGHVAVPVMIGTQPWRRSVDRRWLRTHVRGMNQGVAVLTYGTRWEIYDLHLRARCFADKMVAQLILGCDAPDEPRDVASALHRWLHRDLWWRDPE